MQGGTERVPRRNPLEELRTAPLNTRGKALRDLVSNLFCSPHPFYDADGSLTSDILAELFPSDPIFGPNPCPSPFMASQQAPGGSFSSDRIFGQRPNPFMAAQEAPISEQVNEEKYADADEEDEDTSKNTNSGEHVWTEAQPYTVNPNAACFTTKKTTGSDGLRFEDYKEADSVTSHVAQRRIHDKMDALQKKYNISQEELDDLFEEVWNAKFWKCLPGGCSTHEGEPRMGGGWTLSSTEKLRDNGSSSCSCGEC